MSKQVSDSQTNYSLGDRIEGVFIGTMMTGLFVGGPASIGALAGGFLGFGIAASEVVTHLTSYNSLPEAIASANKWTTVASLITGSSGAIICAKKALEHPWARGAVRMMLGIKPSGIE